MQGHNSDSHGILGWILLSVGLWGGLLALGASLYGYNEANGEIGFAPNPLRGLIVLGCVAAFLGGWALVLRRRRSP